MHYTGFYICYMELYIMYTYNDWLIYPKTPYASFKIYVHKNICTYVCIYSHLKIYAIIKYYKRG